MTQARVLFVDDEPNVLASARRQFRKDFDVHTADSGAAGLAILATAGPFAAVVSDMRMPGMNGAEFLAEARRIAPDTVRMILSGQSDLDAAIAAVNDGRIFRFLTKPCTSDALRAAVEAAVAQHRLVQAEQELLGKTLQGIVGTLTDILGIANPMARQRTNRVRQYAAAMAAALGIDMPWDLRLATLLSQLGCITLPAGLLDRLYAGEALQPAEQAQYARHPEVAAQLVARIPRLETVAAMIGRQLTPADFAALPPDVGAWDPATLSTVILHVATSLDERLIAGEQPATALRHLQAAMPGLPDPIVEAIRAVHQHSAYMDTVFMAVGELAPGMVVDEDVLATDGTTLLARGDELTRQQLADLRGGERAAASPRIRVLIPA
jgi:response regulator RpfG family c-di-GMP phosphodiesterase